MIEPVDTFTHERLMDESINALTGVHRMIVLAGYPTTMRVSIEVLRKMKEITMAQYASRHGVDGVGLLGTFFYADEDPV